ncbi:MAG: M3 family oligoendopeptidase [Clostridia bacterium]|nr:M3 family oligoendopeptidase [Clostridia bacterium]
MNTDWNLDNIYTSVNSEKFTEDFKRYKELIKELNDWCVINFKDKSKAGDKLEKYIELKNEIMSYDRLKMYVNLAQSTDTTNENLAKALDMLESAEAETSCHDTAVVDFVKDIENLEDIINRSDILRAHSFYLSEIKKRSLHTLSANEEAVISKMKNTGSLLWEKQWNQLSSNLTVSFNNEEIPLSQARNLAYNKSAKVRKKAYEAELKAYEKIERPCAFCMNGIKGEVIAISEMRKYKSPLDMTLEESRIDDKILGTMLSAVEEKLESLQEYFLIKANALGHKGSLPFYDLFAPVAESDKSYTAEEARDFVLKCFYGFSKDLGDFAKSAFEKRWLDLMPKKGKAGGAYCETIHSMGESRILANFGGAFDDVITIAHELGHAFHNTRLFHLSGLNSFYPMPIAETASTFCESIVVNEALKYGENNEKINILESDIMGITQCIVDIYSRFLFEDSVFNKRKDGTLSSDELSALMLEAQKRAYGKGLDDNYLHKYMWVCKPHYYDADFNYYNFPYAFGALLSKGLYGIYNKMGDDFLPLYDKFLSASSTMPLYKVAEIMGIDLYSKEFWLAGIDQVVNEIDELKKMLYNSKL